MKNLFYFGVLLVGVVSVVGGEQLVASDEDAVLKLPVLDASSACVAITGSDKCVTPNPFQPADFESLEINKIHDIGDPNFDFSMYGNNQATILVDGVPFARYWQLDDPDNYVFHPMVFGRYVFNSATDEEFQAEVKEITERATVALPNGGVAPYYPNHYPLNRMRGPDLMYSAISQSEILAGYMKLDQAVDSEQVDELLDKVLKALFFKYEEGGVNLDVAQLELPMFRSNPEIILNGWLHALLHMNDYALIYDDIDVANYVHENLQFFVDNYSVWYDEQRNISLYSDTSPHRVVITLDKEDQDIALVYKPKDTRLSSYFFDPVEDIDDEYSSYDFRVVHRNNLRLTVGLTCSRLFDTFVTSNAPFSLSIRGGGYSPYRASPDATGETHELHSVFQNDVHSVELALPESEDELICGYPTNFSKENGKNFYHMQHIVALLYLAQTSSYVDENLDAKLRSIALEWLSRTDDFIEGDGVEFEEPQVVLDSINRGKVLTPIQDVSLLISE